VETAASMPPSIAASRTIGKAFVAVLSNFSTLRDLVRVWGTLAGVAKGNYRKLFEGLMRLAGMIVKNRIISVFYLYVLPAAKHKANNGNCRIYAAGT
jgi:hypothetical protein